MMPQLMPLPTPGATFPAAVDGPLLLALETMDGCVGERQTLYPVGDAERIAN